MKIAFYYPNDWSKLFCGYSQHDWMLQSCDSDCEMIFSFSSRLDGAIASKEKYGIPITAWVWDIPFEWRKWSTSSRLLEDNAGRDAKIRKTVELIKRCDNVITGSKYTQEILAGVGIPATQVYFYIDTKRIGAVPAGEKEACAIQISRFFYNKKFETSIDACARAGKKLIVAGTGREYYKRLAKFSVKRKCNMESMIAAPTDVLMMRLKGSSLLLSPSAFEGWGVTPIEAVHCGVPICLSDLPVFKEVWGDTVPYHKVGDSVSLAMLIRKIMESPQYQAEIVGAASERITEFTPEKFAKRFDEIIAVGK